MKVMLESVVSFYGLNQLIKDPTHILPTTSSCIDLIFTDQTSMIRDSGVHSSLHPNCHHQIIFCKLNLKIYYPPSYERVVWNYEKANIGLISRAINEFDWENSFLHKNIDEQLKIFNVTIMNIFKNFIPNKVITCDDRDPPWINEEVKNFIRFRNEIYKNYVRNGRTTSDYDLLFDTSQQLSVLINNRKSNHFANLSKKLNDPKTSNKTYWSILKTFVNDRKIPIIPPLLVNNQLVTDVLTKSTLFNTYFAEQCNPITNNSTIPINANFLTEKRISELQFSIDDISKIIQTLNPIKAHGYDGISIRMI